MLRTHKLGEADRIVTLLSRNRGQIRAVAKGVRRTASKLGARLEPFMVVDLQCYEGKNLDTVTQVEIIGPYGAEITDQYDSYTVASVICESALKLTDDQPAANQYLLLVGALRSLAKKEHQPQMILNSYLLRALSIAGWAPNFAECTTCASPGPHPAFYIQTGGVVCQSCLTPAAAIVGKDATMLLSALLAGDWAEVEKASAEVKLAASGIVSAYTQWHIDKGLKSISHLERE